MASTDKEAVSLSDLWKSAPAPVIPKQEFPVFARLDGSSVLGELRSSIKNGVLAMDGSQNRCGWCGDDPLYVAYHDQEWGVPERDDRALFEMLMLEGFQAGLSWITVLRKREHFRKVFDNFELSTIARYGSAKVEALLQDEGIIRHRGKVEGTIQSAKAALDIIEKTGSLSEYLWEFVDGEPIVNQCRTMKDVPAQTPASKAMSKALKKQGFKFCGPTICYAFMQATGMVNDHLVDCFRHQHCR